MRIERAGYTILSNISEDGMNELKAIERIARVCYKSEGRITEDGESAKKLVKKLIDLGHEAMLEHSSLSILFKCDRGVSHELVRHRLVAFAQESTRYCNYSKDKFGNEITVISPFFYQGQEKKNEFESWKKSCEEAEKQYLYLLAIGSTSQEARSVLPNSLKTEIVMTANYREWRHFFKLRTAKAAHPQMREITIPLLKDLQSKLPIIFDDIEVEQ